MIWIRRILTAVIGLLWLASTGMGILWLSGSPPEVDASGLISEEDAKALAAPFEDLMAGRDAELKRRFIPQVDVTNVDQAFADMRKAASGTPVRKRRLAYVFWAQGPGGRTLSGRHEQVHEDRIVRVDTQLLRQSDLVGWQLANIYVQSMAKEQLMTARQESLMRTPTLLVIVATFLLMTFTLGTAIAALLMKNIKWRWLWVPLSLVSVGAIRMSALGAWTLDPISIHLLGTGYRWSGSLFDPWIFTLTLPIGAIAFWVMRIRMKPPPDPSEAF